jgi:hypothetical protein
VYRTAFCVWMCSVLMFGYKCVLYCCLCVNVFCSGSTGNSGNFWTTLSEVSHCLFSVVRQMPGYKSRRHGTACSSQFGNWFSPWSFKILFPLFNFSVCSVHWILCTVLCVNVYCCHRVLTQFYLINHNYIVAHNSFIIVKNQLNTVTGFFLWHNPSGRTTALCRIQALTETSTRNMSCVVQLVNA